MDIIRYQRDLEFQKVHMATLQKMKPLIDTRAPSSIELKHLTHRAKKQQIADDRNQEIINENRKLMRKMTEIMTSSKTSNTSLKASSLVEVYRKHQVEKVNTENKQMFARLQHIRPLLKVSNFEKDFQKHKQFKALIKRRQMKPLTLSPIRDHPHVDHSLLDAQSFKSLSIAESKISQRSIFLPSLPPENLSQFRRRVVTPVKAPQLVVNETVEVPLPKDNQENTVVDESVPATIADVEETIVST